MAYRELWRSAIRLDSRKIIITDARKIHGISTNLINKIEKLLENKTRGSSETSRSLFRNEHNLDFTPKRWKFGKSRKGEAEEEDDEDEDEKDKEFESLVVGKNAKIIHPNTPSMRIDAVVKSGIGLARKEFQELPIERLGKAEAALYESRIRVNGEKLLKKSYNANINDVIDVIIGPSPKNPKFTLVNRITILDAESSTDHIKLKLLREKNLVVDDYKDSYKLSSDD